MKKNKILQIDDNLDMLLIGERAFTSAGFEYISARCGEEGLEKVKTESPDFIILDYILPDINGAQFLHAYTQSYEFSQISSIPIILITAHPEIVDDLALYYRLGLRAVLNKPFGHRELVNVVENILHQEKIRMIHGTKSGISNGGKHIPAELIEDLQMAIRTIAQLSADLKASGIDALNEEQLLDFEAIYTTSKRLLRLLEAGLPVNKLVATESFYS